jgi:hypothetical protein
MDSIKLKQSVEAFLKRDESSKEIIQTLSKAELDEVIDVLYVVGSNLVMEQLAKAEYRVPGVTHTGVIPADHPEHQVVVDHINKLMALPDTHKYKDQAKTAAKMLYDRHISPPKGSVIDDKGPAAPKPSEQSVAHQTNTIDYGQIKPAPVVSNVDPDKLNRQIHADRAMGVFTHKPT